MTDRLSNAHEKNSRGEEIATQIVPSFKKKNLAAV